MNANFRGPEAPNPQREFKRALEWNPGKSLLASVRCWQRHAARPGALSAVLRRLEVLRYRFWSVVTGADIPLNSRLGLGLLLPHPNGIVIHPAADIGVNCLILQQVTIGTDGSSQVPRIGNRVDIGAGAKILGGVVIGDHALIGANAVVVRDVPAWHVAVGVPATVRPRKDMPTELHGLTKSSV